MTIGDILTEQARRRPDAVALVDGPGGTRRLTFAGLEREVDAAAQWLGGYGLGRGDGVLVFVPMSTELYVALLALFRLGAVALFLDPSAGRTHLERCCARWQPAAMLAVPKAHLLRFTSPALRAIPRHFVINGWVPGAIRWRRGTPERTAARADVRESDPALVTFTSGSTGVPKAAVRTHGFLVAQHRVLAPNIALEPGEVDLATLPIFTLANLASGVTTIIPEADARHPGRIDARRIARQIEAGGVTRITASPAFFARLAAHLQREGRTLPQLRKLHTGGAPVFPGLLDALAIMAPQAGRVAVYGSTEAEPIAHLAAEEIGPDERAEMQRGGGLLAGHVVTEIRLRILRDRWGQPRATMTSAELEQETQPVNAAGEIVVAGDHVLRGYLGGIGDEETKFTVDGTVWHRTGDAGRRDEHGRLWLLGRCAAKVEDDRGVLYPFSVECGASLISGVERAAFIAHAGKRLLVIEPRAGAEIAWEGLRASLAWAQIDEFMTMARLPVDVRHNAKIDYPALQRKLAREV